MDAVRDGIGQMGPRTRQVAGFGDRYVGGGNFFSGGRANVGRPIVTNGEFAASWPFPKLLWDFLFSAHIANTAGSVMS